MSDEDIWRRFYVRTWSDRRVMALSRPTPNGQTLLTWLIAGKQTGIIPGLFEVGERAFAEMLGWPLHGGETLLEGLPKGLPKGFREAFEEVAAQGFVKADWKAHLVYVPNALRLDPPWNPNMVLKWRKAWRALPECELKDEAEQAFRTFFKGFSKGFREAFEEVCAKGLANQDPGSRIQESGERIQGRARKSLRSEEKTGTENHETEQGALVEAGHVLAVWTAIRQEFDRPGPDRYDEHHERAALALSASYSREQRWRDVLRKFASDDFYGNVGFSLVWLAKHAAQVDGWKPAKKRDASEKRNTVPDAEESRARLARMEADAAEAVDPETARARLAEIRNQLEGSNAP